MEVSEIIRLADWLEDHMSGVEPKYAALVTVLQNNAQQASQQPVTEPLKDLSKALIAMPMQEVSTLQMRVLQDLEVDNLVGKLGRQWLNQKVRSTTYDPATTFQTIQQAAQKLAEAKRKLKQYKSAAAEVGFDDGEELDAPSPYIINVIFQGNAAIENVRDWKKTAADWELIFAGVAGVVDEKPEEVKILGTSNGSIIFTLSASPLVTKVLATISKHIASIANNYLDFQLKREELERSRMMTKVIADDLALQETSRRSEGKKAVLEAVQKIVPDASPETMAMLEKAVEKHIAFSESGGEVDFVSPPSQDEEAEDYDEDLAETVDEIRGLIEEYRAEQQQTALLTYQGDEDDDDE
jgi:hypothetical protein